ncbi:MAG: hypothetical protein ACRBI6_11020 [Acidimicrobiales bacterium]
MTEQPPPTSGWTDGYGQTHEGAPPEGYWIASDDRWYPPELAADAAPTDAVPTDELADFAAPAAAMPTVGDDPASSFDAPGSFPPPGAPPAPAPDPAAAPDAGFGPPSAAPPMTPPPGAAPMGAPAPMAAPGAPGGPGAPGFPAPDPSATGGSGDDSKKLLMIGAAVLAAVVLLGGAAFAVLGGGDDEAAETVEAITGDDESTETTAASGSDTTEATETTETTEPSDAGSESTETTQAGDGSTPPPVAEGARVGAEGISCAPRPDELMQLVATNSTSDIVDYWLTVAFFDDAGNRIADEAAWLDSIRPGETIVEDQFTFEEGWTTCEVIDADVSSVDLDPTLLADVSACTVEGADFAGDVSGSVSVTNSGDAAGDYVVDVALIDPSGQRRGTGTIYIDQVRPGETAPGDLFTWVDHEPGFTCEVVTAIRYDA